MHVLKLFLIGLFLFPFALHAQEASPYLAGAVPVNEKGVVVFSKTFEVPGKSAQEIYTALKSYTEKAFFHTENALPQTRYTADSTHLLALSVEEYLYFKKKAWVTHRTRFYYDLIYQIENNQFTITMQRLHYRYEAEETPNNQVENYRAEEWITDNNALNKKGQLTRIAGKFRRFTIDRKNEIFLQSAQAAGAKLKTKVVMSLD